MVYFPQFICQHIVNTAMRTIVKSKDSHFHFRASRKLKQLVARAAEKSGCDNESAWIRRTLEEAANRELEKPPTEQTEQTE